MKRSMKEIKRVFSSGSMYAFLLYLLISDMNEINSTFYFFGQGISERIKTYFRGRCHSFYKTEYNTSIKSVLLALKIRFFKITRWRFLNNPSMLYYGHDHNLFSWPLVGNNYINVLEDGLGNYYPLKFHKTPKGAFHWLKKKIYGPLYSDRNFWLGGGVNVCKIYLTNLVPESDIMHNPKVNIIDIFEIWRKSSEEKKDFILNIFGLSVNDVNELKKYKKIVYTQPLDIDFGITEEEKVKFYSNNIGGFSVNNIVIKSHPRENTNYAQYFPNAFFFNKKVPSELLKMCGIEFNEIYTINSTASMGNKSDVIVHNLNFDKIVR